MWPGTTWNPALTQLPVATPPVPAFALPNYPALTLSAALPVAPPSVYQPVAYSWKPAQDDSLPRAQTAISASTSMHAMFPLHAHIPVLTDKEAIVIQWLCWESIQFCPISHVISCKCIQLAHYILSWFCIVINLTSLDMSDTKIVW